MMLWMLAGLALAQDPDFDETVKDAEEVEKAEGSVSAEIGGSFTGGNTEFYTASASLAGAYKWKNNGFSARMGALYGRGRADSDASGSLDATELAAPMVQTAGRFDTEARYDRFFGEKNSLYLLAGALIDSFAGYDLRTHEQFGYSRLLVSNDTTNLISEIGIDYAQENYVAGVDPNYADVIAARVMAGFNHKFSKTVGFEETVEAFENLLVLEDLRVNNHAAVSVGLSDKMTLKLSHDLRFDNQPVEGFRPLDHTALVTLTATLL